MATEKIFARILSKLRRAQGFSSAYSFYKARGGTRVFGLSYANYLNLEQGKSLPQGKRLRKILEGLGVSPESPAGRDLVRAYFRDVLGSDELLRSWSAPLAPDPAPTSWQIAENASRQALRQRSLQLSLEQYKVLAGDRVAYSCHVILANTRSWVEKKKLAAMTRHAISRMRRPLAKLKAASLIEESGSKVRSPLAGKYIVPPEVTPATSAIYARLQSFREDWIRNHGRVHHKKYLVLRASRSKFASYLPHLSDVVGMAALYGDVEPTPDSAMFLVEARVMRLFD